jgi:hypothetical protein
VKRRDFLKNSLACLALGHGLQPQPAGAIGRGQRFRLVRIQHQGGWDIHQGAVGYFAKEFGLRSSVDVDSTIPGVELGSPEFLQTPMAVLLGNRDFSFSDKQRSQLKRWLEMGGFLLVDNGSRGTEATAFDKAVRREFAAMFPRRPFSRVSPDHVIYRSFYRLDYPAGRAIHKPYIDGIVLGKRVAVVLNHNDLFGAFAPGGDGQFKWVPRPGGESQREIAMRFAVNIALYGLCLHYKDDQVHLDYLLHRRKWKVRPHR